MDAVSVQVLVDEQAQAPGLAAEHGLSIRVRAAHLDLLFDAGQSDLLLANAAALGADLGALAWLVLSHGHYDHTGGVPALLAAGARPHVLWGRGAWARRRAATPGGPAREIGIPWPRALLQEQGVVGREIRAPHPLHPGVWLTGPARPTPDLTAPTLRRARGRRWPLDRFPEELALSLLTVRGLVLVTGCSHTGIANLVAGAQQATGVDRLYAVLGGLHLHQASAAQCGAVAAFLRAAGVEHLWVNHCTGRKACELLAATLPGRVEWAGAGFTPALPPLRLQ